MLKSKKILNYSGWVCTRHDRHDRWPIIEEENWEGLSSNDNFYSFVGSDSERNSNEPIIQSEFYVVDADSSTTDEDLPLAADTRKFYNSASVLFPGDFLSV